MGYLDNSSITVDAILTKKGRELLKNGGNLTIDSFTTSDVGVDYTLWNPSHPSGSAFYGEAIENLPMLEANVHAEYNLRNRLITLNQKAIALPTLVISGLDSKNATKLTFNEGDQLLGKITVDLVGYGSSGGPFYLIIQDTNIISTDATSMGGLSGASNVYISEADIQYAEEFRYENNQFILKPKQVKVKGKSTNVYVYDSDTGAQASFTVVNNIVSLPQAILSSGGIR